MTAKLADRLSRLEASVGQVDTATPPTVASIWLHAMAITLGGFPGPWQETYQTHGGLDRPADGLARALGYADAEAMDAGAEADPDEWRFRLDLVHTALVENLGGDARDGFGLACKALDWIASAKARGAAYEPKLEIGRPESSLHRALLHLGVSPDALCAGERA